MAGRKKRKSKNTSKTAIKGKSKTKSRQSSKRKRLVGSFQKRFGLMHVRHLLYKNWPGRYNNWDETREDAVEAINYLLSLGYRSATVQGLRNYVKDSPRKKQTTKQKSKLKDWRELIPKEIPIGEPQKFFTASDFCHRWKYVNPKVYCFSKDIWPGQRFYGGKDIDYYASFARWARLMARLQQQKKGSYDIDWHYMLLEPIMDKKQEEWKIKIISCNANGEHVRWKESGEKEIGPEVQEPLPKGKVEPTPEEKKEIPPEIIEKPPAAPLEFTKEERIELEKEKIKAEAKAKSEAEAEVKKKKIDTLKELLKEGIITKNEFFEQLQKI